MLVNHPFLISLLGEERMIVDNRPGTTRGRLLTLVLCTKTSPFELVDTAGMRRKSSIKDELENGDDFNVQFRAFVRVILLH